MATSADIMLHISTANIMKGFICTSKIKYKKLTTKSQKEIACCMHPFNTKGMKVIQVGFITVHQF